MGKHFKLVLGEGLVEIPAPPTAKKLAHISDEMPPTLHPCDGKYYTSKARFRAETRGHGKIEAGNEFVNGGFKPRQDEDIPGFRDDFVQAREECRSMSPGQLQDLRNSTGQFIPELDGPDA